METQLLHMLGTGDTHLRGRLKFSTVDDIVFRTYVRLNTTKSTVMSDGYVRKFICFGGSKSRHVDSRYRVGLGSQFIVGQNRKARNGRYFSWPLVQGLVAR
jgi:hypothetical protein